MIADNLFPILLLLGKGALIFFLFIASAKQLMAWWAVGTYTLKNFRAYWKLEQYIYGRAAWQGRLLRFMGLLTFLGLGLIGYEMETSSSMQGCVWPLMDTLGQGVYAPKQNDRSE